MIFVGTINIEIFKPDNAFNCAGLECPQIEEMFRITIHIKRLKYWRGGILIAIALRAIAIGGGTGGIDKSNFMTQAPFAKCAGITIIVFEKVICVLFGGGAARAQMNARCCLRSGVGLHTFNERSE